MLTLVAPGQGAQTPGFLTPWCEIDAFASTIDALSEVCGLDLVYYGTQANEDQIRDTMITQPLLVAASIATAGVLFEQEPASVVGLAAGHSVGEVSAAAIAGALSNESAMTFVAARGRLMAQASALEPTSMAAVIGGQPDEVVAAIEAAGLTAANNNGRGQIVAGGTVEALRAFQAAPPRRTRVIELSVAGAFHTIHMQPALDALRVLAADIVTQTPSIPLISNAAGDVVESGDDFLAKLVTQVANPVRWDRCMETMRARGTTGLLELPPAGTLTGIAKRNLDVELFSLNTPDQLLAAREFIARHQA